MDGRINPLDMYEQQNVMGEGTYGQVCKCLNKETGENVAVKKIKIEENTNYVIWRELQMLKAISSLDPDAYNIVRFKKYFKSRAGHHFMEFEMLDQSVWDLMMKQKTSFSLQEIRPMAKQLLIALHGLKSLGVMHNDIKPDNIMLVDHKKTPFKVKLIDFGLAMLKTEAIGALDIQPNQYRAPEVTLGLPLSEAVDMWSLGCCLLVWYLRKCPFNGCSSYNRLKQICHLLGVPDGDLITRAKHGTDFFVQEDSQWRLKTPSEYEKTQGVAPEMRRSVLENAANLQDGVVYFYENPTWLEFTERMAFVNLIQKMFVLNPEKRITPAEALQDPFITMDHLSYIYEYIVKSKEITNFMPTLGLGQDLNNNDKNTFKNSPAKGTEMSNRFCHESETFPTCKERTKEIPVCSQPEGIQLSEGEVPKSLMCDAIQISNLCNSSKAKDDDLGTEIPVCSQPDDVQLSEGEVPKSQMCHVSHMNSVIVSSTPKEVSRKEKIESAFCSVPPLNRPVIFPPKDSKRIREAVDCASTASKLTIFRPRKSEEESAICEEPLRNTQANLIRAEDQGVGKEIKAIFPPKNIKRIRESVESASTASKVTIFRARKSEEESAICEEPLRNIPANLINAEDQG